MVSAKCDLLCTNTRLYMEELTRRHSAHGKQCIPTFGTGEKMALGGKLPPKSCLVDGGFTGDTFMMWVMDLCHWVVQVVLRPNEHKGFVLLPKRWVVERTFGWLSWCRRLSRDHEGLPETSEMWIYIAMIRIMVRRLA
jgi:transposase